MSKTCPFDFICFDTEDNSAELMKAGKSGFDKKVTQIAAITGEGKRYYNRGNVPHFLEWLERQPERYVYALNVGYDLGNLFSKRLDVLDSRLLGGRIMWSDYKGKIFVDVFNIWPMSVKMLGKAFGLEKLETGSMATDREYVFRDVEIIHKAMLFVWEACQGMEIKKVPPTLGGLGMQVWKKLGGTNCHDSNQLSRLAYFGGRVELFKHRNETRNVCWTDINSLYPSVMTGEFPGPMTDYGRKLPDWGIAEVTIRIPEMPLTPLPFRKDNGQIVYPFGTIRGAWTMAEIKYAVSLGSKIIKVHQAVGTNETQSPYKDYVEKLYNLRLQANSPAESLFYKLLLNTRYGRLGATGIISRTVWQTERNKFDGVPFGEKVLINQQMPLDENTNWSHAAYVTAYGRIALHGFMSQIGADRMIYADTDSTIFDCPDRRIPFPVGDKLGQMKLVEWVNGCETFAPKMYHAGKTWKAKGVPKKLARQFIETGRAEFELPFKMREAIRFYDKNNSRRLSVWRKVEKQNRQHYDRKILKSNHYFPCKLNVV